MKLLVKGTAPPASQNANLEPSTLLSRRMPRTPHLGLLRLDPASGRLESDTGLWMWYVATDGSSVWALGTLNKVSP